MKVISMNEMHEIRCASGEVREILFNPDPKGATK